MPQLRSDTHKPITPSLIQRGADRAAPAYAWHLTPLPTHIYVSIVSRGPISLIAQYPRWNRIVSLVQYVFRMIVPLVSDLLLAGHVPALLPYRSPSYANALHTSSVRVSLNQPLSSTLVFSHTYPRIVGTLFIYSPLADLRDVTD